MDKPVKPDEINGDARISYLENLFEFAQQEADARSKLLCGRVGAVEKELAEVKGTTQKIVWLVITGLAGLVLALIGGIIGLVGLFLQL